jgi:hypothetical protein
MKVVRGRGRTGFCHEILLEIPAKGTMMEPALVFRRSQVSKIHSGEWFGFLSEDVAFRRQNCP